MRCVGVVACRLRHTGYGNSRRSLETGLEAVQGFPNLIGCFYRERRWRQSSANNVKVRNPVDGRESRGSELTVHGRLVKMRLRLWRGTGGNSAQSRWDAVGSGGKRAGDTPCK